ncbi:hypothetical protein [Methylobacillus arboreus]|nr:hypothetical protein [Methylobacillus arboreus]
MVGQPGGHGPTRLLRVAVLGEAMSITCGLRLDQTRFETMLTA